MDNAVEPEQKLKTFYLYVKANPDWIHEKKYKYGYTKNPVNRLHDSIEEHSEKSQYVALFEFKETKKYQELGFPERPDEIISTFSSQDFIEMPENDFGELSYLQKLIPFLVKSKTKETNEFIYSDGLDTLENVFKYDFPKLGLLLAKEFDPEEIAKINASKPSRSKQKSNKKELREKLLSKLREIKMKRMKRQIPKKVSKQIVKFIERDYQTEIITHAIETLTKDQRMYLELATGGGKTYIMYKLFNMISPDVIVQFSPRKKINSQNSSSKYFTLLKSDIYAVFNCSESKTADFADFYKRCQENQQKIIIVACPQKGHEKIYGFIQEFQLSNIFVWFDEAHHTIEGWMEPEKHEKRETAFFLQDTNHIKNRMFTSASPNKELVEERRETFGEYYKPITVKELIDQKWLCGIKCEILEKDIDNFDLLEWIFHGFNKNNKSFGFSFHSRDNNAFNLFYKHYKLYITSKTNIKPYLLIDKSGLDKNNSKKAKTINLDYEYDNPEEFENNSKSNKEEQPKHIAYVVKQYDMGYDFPNLDLIVITDPKTSYKAIIQCIGRGTRPDQKGVNGKNLDKSLLLMLPTYIKNEEKNDYKNIIEVLRYLVLDLEMDIEETLIKQPTEPDMTFEDADVLTGDVCGGSVCAGGVDVSGGAEYKGSEKNTSVLLDMLYNYGILKKINMKTLHKFCKKYNIKTEQDYYKFKELNPSLNLKSNLYEYPGFYWKNVVDPEGEYYYSSKHECINAKEEIIHEAANLNDEEYEELMVDIEDNGWVELNKHDPKIPPYRDLDKFYPQL